MYIGKSTGIKGGQTTDTTKLYGAIPTAYPTNVDYQPVNGTSANDIFYNAMGMHPDQLYIYGIMVPKDPATGKNEKLSPEADSNTLVRVGNDGVAETLGSVSGLELNKYTAGDFDDDGNLFVFARSGNFKMFFIKDINSINGSDISGVTAQEVAVTFPTGVTTVSSGDIVYDGEKFWGVHQLTDPATGKLTTEFQAYTITVDRAMANATVAFHGQPQDLQPHYSLTDPTVNITTAAKPKGFGVMYADANGYVFANNNAGGFFAIDKDATINDDALSFFKTSAGSSLNDGASCRAGSYIYPDNDGDGILDNVDLDDDNDGILDDLEGACTRVVSNSQKWNINGTTAEYVFPNSPN